MAPSANRDWSETVSRTVLILPQICEEFFCHRPTPLFPHRERHRAGVDFRMPRSLQSTEGELYWSGCHGIPWRDRPIYSGHRRLRHRNRSCAVPNTRRTGEGDSLCQPLPEQSRKKLLREGQGTSRREVLHGILSLLPPWENFPRSHWPPSHQMVVQPERAKRTNPTVDRNPVSLQLEIEYRPGKRHGNADALSRCPNPRDCQCPEQDNLELKCGPCKKCLKRTSEGLLRATVENKERIQLIKVHPSQATSDDTTTLQADPNETQK